MRTIWCVEAPARRSPFHASAKITCVPFIEKVRKKKPQACEAFVIRRGFAGTATVEIPHP